MNVGLRLTSFIGYADFGLQGAQQYGRVIDKQYSTKMAMIKSRKNQTPALVSSDWRVFPSMDSSRSRFLSRSPS